MPVILTCFKGPVMRSLQARYLIFAKCVDILVQIVLMENLTRWMKIEKTNIFLFPKVISAACILLVC